MNNRNRYKQSTKYFGIPVPGWKDGIWPELELLKWQMVENMLMAAMRGNVNAVFREGDMRVKQEGSGKYSVTLAATGNEPALQGSVGGAYFDVPATFVWPGLESGFAYYLYVKGSERTFQDAGDVISVASTTRLSTKYATLVAKVDLKVESPTLDRNPPGKVNARDLAQHVLDYDNPHGSQMVQDELLIRKRLVLGDGADAQIALEVSGQPVTVSAVQLAETLTTTRTIVDFVAGGIKGVTLTASGRVVFASVVRTGVEDRAVGDVIVGFYGLHPDVKVPNQVIVWNSGESGAAMRAMILCG